MFGWSDVLSAQQLPVLVAAMLTVLATVVVAVGRERRIRRHLPGHLRGGPPAAVAAWKVSRLVLDPDGGLVLSGLTVGASHTAPLAAAVARCDRAAHTAPVATCSCGFWAFYDEQRARKLAARPVWRHPGNVVTLAVALSGATVVCREGVRAARQDVHTLRLPPCTVCRTPIATSVAVRTDRTAPTSVWGFCGCDHDRLLEIVSTYRGYGVGRVRGRLLRRRRGRARPCGELTILPASRIAADARCPVTLADGTAVTGDRERRIADDALRWLDDALYLPPASLRDHVDEVAAAMEAAGQRGADLLAIALGALPPAALEAAPTTAWELARLLDPSRRSQLLTAPGADHWRRVAGLDVDDFDGYLAAMTAFHGPSARGALRWWVTLPVAERTTVPLDALPDLIRSAAAGRVRTLPPVTALPQATQDRLLAELATARAEATDTFTPHRA